MNCQSISKLLVSIDQCCDFIPVVSSLTNLVNVALKALKDCFNVCPSTTSHYYAYLDSKSYLKIGLLIIPLIGTFIAVLEWENVKEPSSHRPPPITLPVTPLSVGNSPSQISPQEEEGGFSPRFSPMSEKDTLFFAYANIYRSFSQKNI